MLQELLVYYHTSLNSIVTMLLKSKVNSLTYENRHKSYEENINNSKWYFYYTKNSLYSSHFGECTNTEEQVKYLNELLQWNNIDSEQLRNDIRMIMEMRHNKINTLVSK